MDEATANTLGGVRRAFFDGKECKECKEGVDDEPAGQPWPSNRIPPFPPLLVIVIPFRALPLPAQRGPVRLPTRYVPSRKGNHGERGGSMVRRGMDDGRAALQ